MLYGLNLVLVFFLFLEKVNEPRDVIPAACLKPKGAVRMLLILLFMGREEPSSGEPIKLVWVQSKPQYSVLPLPLGCCTLLYSSMHYIVNKESPGLLAYISVKN